MATVTIKQYTPSTGKVEDVPVKAVAVVGPFAVHRDVGQYQYSKAPWNVTHVPTGLVATKGDTKQQAIQAAKRLTALEINWYSADVAKGKFTMDEQHAIKDALWEGIRAANRPAKIVARRVQKCSHCRRAMTFVIGNGWACPIHGLVVRTR